MNQYRCAGLSLVSEFPLPLDRIEGGGPDLVLVRRENLADRLATELPLAAGGARYGAVAEGVLVRLGDRIQFLIRHDQILVHGDARSDLADLVVRVAVGFVLQVRGVLSFHGAAVRRHDTTLALLGPRGVGKSTASLGLVQRGWSLLSDDLVVVQPDGSVPQGPARSRLNGDSLGVLGLADPCLGKDTDGKWVVEPRRKAVEGVLTSLCVLTPSTTRTVGIQELRGREKLQAVLEHLHSPVGIGDPARRWTQAAALLSRVRAFRVERPQDRFALTEVLDLVESQSLKEPV